MTAQAQVLIVGAGPSGLILALTLLRNGISVRIIEKNPLPKVGQRGFGIMPRSLEIFEFLGIIDSVMQRSIRVPMVRIYKGLEILKEFEKVPVLEPTPITPYPNARHLGQDNLEIVIKAEMKKYNSYVEMGVELVSFEQFHDRVKVKLHRHNIDEPGAEPEEEESEYEWVIGADGPRSVVRKLLGLTFLGQTKVDQFVVGDIKVEGLAERWHMWRDLETQTTTSIRFTETPGVFHFFVGGAKLNNIDEIIASEDAIRALLRKQTLNRTDITFGNLVYYSTHGINIRMVDNFGKGRVFVAGDAAHVNSPTGGQGMNTGVQDSFNLGWKLAHVIKGFSLPSILNTYTEERAPVVAEMLNVSTALLNLSVNQPTNEATYTRTGNVNQLGVNYRWSSILVDQSIESGTGLGTKKVLSAYDAEVGGVVRAGDRAPDASGLIEVKSDNQKSSESIRLFKLLSPTRHTVLIFAEAADVYASLIVISKYPKDLVRAVVVVRAGTTNITQYPACDVFEDCDGYTHDAYRSAEGANGVVAIRPDGFIGAIVKDANWLERYFRAIIVDPRK